MIDVEVEQSHTDDFPYEIHDRNIEQTEHKQPEGAEIERQQSIPEDYWQRLVVEFLADTLWDVFRSTKLLTQFLHQTLELRSHLFLFLRIVDVRLLEVALGPTVRLRCHLVVDFLLTLGVVEFSTLLAFQEEEVYLDVIVCQTLLTSQSCNTGDDSQDVDDNGGDDHILLCILNTQQRELYVVVQVETVNQ